MSACEGGRYCPACHPWRWLAIYVGGFLAYIGFLYVVLWWMP